MFASIKNDVFRLTELLDFDQELLPDLPEAIHNDMNEFIVRMETEDVDLKQLSISGKTKLDILNQLRRIYG